MIEDKNYAKALMIDKIFSRLQEVIKELREISPDEINNFLDEYQIKLKCKECQTELPFSVIENKKRNMVLEVSFCQNCLFNTKQGYFPTYYEFPIRDKYIFIENIPNTKKQK